MKLSLIYSSFKKFVFSLALVASGIFSVSAQNHTIAYTANYPSLSQELVNQYRMVYEFILEIKLTKQQKARLQNGLIGYWRQNNAEGIEQTISDSKYYGKTEELISIRQSSQKIIIEAFRRDSNDSVSNVFIEAYDATHPDSASLTKIKTLADLVGTWKRTDALLAERTYANQPAGVSYTETETLEILPTGEFKHIKVHSHYSGNCSRTEGKTEIGRINLTGTKLIFQTEAGSMIINDGCFPSLNRRTKLKPHQESFPWSINTNADHDKVLTLCWNTSSTTAVCFEKQ